MQGWLNGFLVLNLESKSVQLENFRAVQH